MKHALLLLPLVAASAAPALAQDKDDLRVRVGIGAQVRPDFPGSKDRDAAPLVDVDIARGEEPFRIEAPDDTFGLRLVQSERFTLGPAANIRPSRTAAKVGAPVERVSPCVAGAGIGGGLSGSPPARRTRRRPSSRRPATSWR